MASCTSVDGCTWRPAFKTISKIANFVEENAGTMLVSLLLFQRLGICVPLFWRKPGWD